MKTTLCLTFTLLTFVTLAFVPNSFAGEVKVIYFLPNDRDERAGIDDSLDSLIKSAQEFYAENMDNHGFGRSTFSFETDSDGNAVVHHVDGARSAASYQQNSYQVVTEVNQQFDTQNNICLIYLDHKDDATSGGFAGYHNNGAGGVAVVFALDIESTVHELGHAFGLWHDARSSADKTVESNSVTSGLSTEMIRTYCAAKLLSVSQYFGSSGSSSGLTTINMLTPLRSPPDSVKLRFEISDTDGLNQAQLLISSGEGVIACKALSGESETVEYILTNAVATRVNSNGGVLLYVSDDTGYFTNMGFTLDLTELLAPPEEISIPDTGLAALIRQKLGLTSDAKITQNDMLELISLSPSAETTITDLTGLEYALNMAIFRPSSINVSDLSPLSGLPKLSGLSLRSSQISDISQLANLTNLWQLSLDSNQISDITAISGLTRLTELSLISNQISNISPLSGLTNLQRLRIFNNQISDLSPLSGLTTLQELHISSNNISDVSSLANLTNLTHLNLYWNNISDVSSLANLTNLTHLNLSSNNISDVSSLTGLTNLVELSLYGNSITDRSPLETLKSQNPSLTINIESVTIVNRSPEFTEGSSATRSVFEGTGADVNISSPVSATDADNDTLTYSLSGTDAGSFVINTGTGQLKTKVGVELDFETKFAYTVTVTATDTQGNTDTITVTINIQDVNETADNNPPIFGDGSTTSRSIDENAVVGANIGSPITATDADNDTLTYSLSGTDASAFDIDTGTGQLKTKATLDYDTKNTYTVVVTATDGEGLTAIITVNISIQDVDETAPNNPPIFGDGSTTSRSIDENAVVGANIGSPITATDADNDTLTYSLSGTDASAFDIDTGTGQLKTKATLDYDTKNTYTVVVTATDGEGLTAIITVNISIQDVDETAPNNPPIFGDGSTTSRSIDENAVVGANIGSPITATDADNDTLTYSLSGTDASAFDIDTGTGQLKTKATLDYDTKNTYTVVVTATDGEGLTAIITVNINIQDVNETSENNPPVFGDGSSATRSVLENTEAGVNIPGSPITATDADNDALTYSLSGTDASAFDIDTGTGQLKTKATLDYDTKNTYTVEVSVSDDKGGSASITVTINVTQVDVNQPPPEETPVVDTTPDHEQISFSELMFATRGGLDSLAQWMELSNSSDTNAVNLKGWQLEIEARDKNGVHRHAVIPLEALHIPANQTALIVTWNAQRKSEGFSEDLVYNFFNHHSDEFEQNVHRNMILGSVGFLLKLTDTTGVVVDVVGNLDGDPATADEPAWEIPSGTTENGARTSLLRRYDKDTRMPLDGTGLDSWRSSSKFQLLVTRYWGSITDIGNPGYRGGGAVPVTLSHFRAEHTDAGVVLKWTTESEVDNAGFNILRSHSKNGTFKVVNPTMIQGAGTTGERNEYTWTDTSAKPNTVYYYQIEDVSHAGDRKQLATVRLRGLITASGKRTTRWSDLKTQN